MGDEALAQPEQWDQLSRDAQIVSELPRWIVGLRAHAEAEREASGARGVRVARRSAVSIARRMPSSFSSVVKLLSGTLDALAGEASWTEWSDRLVGVLDQWIGPGPDREAVAEVLADLGGLSSAADRARWSEVEEVLEARFEWERMPLDPIEHGGRARRRARRSRRAALPRGGGRRARGGRLSGRLPARSLPARPRARGTVAAARPDGAGRTVGATARTRLAASSRSWTRSRATRPLVPRWGPHDGPPAHDPGPPARGAPRLPRRDQPGHGEAHPLLPPRRPAPGRERLPSLFLVAAASALLGRPAGAADLDGLVVEDDPACGAAGAHPRPLGARPQARAARAARRRCGDRGGLARSSAQSRRAARARWYARFSEYDGFVGELPADLRATLDPLQRVVHDLGQPARHLLALRLPVPAAARAAPRARARAGGAAAARSPGARHALPRGGGALPARAARPGRAAGARTRRRCRSASWPRPTRPSTASSRARRRASPCCGSARSASFRSSRPAVARPRGRRRAERSTPALLRGGLRHARAPQGPREPHSRGPSRASTWATAGSLRVIGKIDRIDERPDGTLLLRDYKTGKAPRDDGGIFRGGKQLQIPFYVLAARAAHPRTRRVTEAFLDYVDGGRQVAFDPARVTGEDFRKFLARDAGRDRRAASSPRSRRSCDFCDFTAACGPRASSSAGASTSWATAT